MKLPNTHRLHALRMLNDQAGYEMQDQAERFATIAGRHVNGTAPRAVVAHQLFQTPSDLAARLVALLDLAPGSRVLEPSAGLGRILDCLPMSKVSEVVAIDQSPDCTAELFKQDRQGVKILQRDFLSVLPDEIGHFNAVAMNPPFTVRSDIKHIRHAMDFLRPGGRLACIMMDTPRRETTFRDEATHWEKLPENSFSKEGTQVATVLALFSL